MSALSGTEAAITGTVSGRVQGVGFRMSAQWRARQLELAGWVRNLADGRVEVFAQGSQERLDDFVSWLRTGPAAARVDRVAVGPAEPDASLRGFGIR